MAALSTRAASEWINNFRDAVLGSHKALLKQRQLLRWLLDGGRWVGWGDLGQDVRNFQEVGFDEGAEFLLVEGRGGVEAGEDPEGAELAGLAVDAADGFALEPAGHGEAAEGDDDLGVDQGDLLVEEGAAGGHFLGQGVAVAGRAAFDHVGDEHLLAGEADGAKQLLQELAGGADEGAALLVLVEAGPLADEHEIAGRGAFAGHGELAAAMEAALLAGANFGRDVGN